MITTITFLFLNKTNPNKHTHKFTRFPAAQTVIDQLDTSLDPTTTLAEIENIQPNTNFN